jgi:hypothetical protein
MNSRTSRASTSRVVGALLERHGRTYAAEAHIRLERGTPSPLFRLLCLSLLLSARIRAEAAVAAAIALCDHGWTTARKMADSTWTQRTRALNRAGYARYDESTSRMLGDTCDLVIDRYGGDLRVLRDEAGRDQARLRRLVKEFKGIGDVGADIFFREVQVVWDELQPFADRRMTATATMLGLPGEAAKLRRLVPDVDTYARLAAALVRCGLARDHDEIISAARST